MEKSPHPIPELPKRCSLITETVESLQEGIQSGFWRDYLPGERILSERLQVSRPTLRSALDELERMGWIKTEARRPTRILEGGRGSADGEEGRIISVLCSDAIASTSTAGNFMMDVLRDKLGKANCRVEFHSNRSCFSSRPAKALAKLVEDNPSSAWLVLGSREPTQRWFHRHQLPCLVVGSCAGNIDLPSVDVDYRAACHHAGGLLWRAGHRRIAYIQLAKAQAGDVDSEEGLQDSLRGLEGAQVQVLRHDGSESHICALLDESLGSSLAPTAYLVARPMHVLTVLTHLQRRGKRIPRDLALIARDDAPFLEVTSPSVARYATNPAGLARRVARAARQLAESGSLPAKAVRLVPKFVPGETVGK